MESQKAIGRFWLPADGLNSFESRVRLRRAGYDDPLIDTTPTMTRLRTPVPVDPLRFELEAKGMGVRWTLPGYGIVGVNASRGLH
jgi:hypothetical protein